MSSSDMCHFNYQCCKMKTCMTWSLCTSEPLTTAVPFFLFSGQMALYTTIRSSSDHSDRCCSHTHCPGQSKSKAGDAGKLTSRYARHCTRVIMKRDICRHLRNSRFIRLERSRIRIQSTGHLDLEQLVQ